jgi:hypothetical protein
MGSIPFTSKPDMADNIMNEGDIDPEIADLLGDDTSPSSIPDFSDLFDEPVEDEPKDPKDMAVEDFTKETFSVIEKWEQDPDPVFFEKDYYAKVLTGEGEISKRIHSLLQKFLKCEDPQERGVFPSASHPRLVGSGPQHGGKFPVGEHRKEMGPQVRLHSSHSHLG